MNTFMLQVEKKCSKQLEEAVAAARLEEQKEAARVRGKLVE